MRETAEIARTLATGAHPGQLRVAWHPAAHSIAHITDEFGQPVFLLDDASLLAGALHSDTEDDIAAVLHINAREHRTQLWISGWAAPLRGADERKAADAYAQKHPVGELLDLGRGATLYRIEVAEVRLGRGNTHYDIDIDEYYAASGREQDAWPLRAH